MCGWVILEFVVSLFLIVYNLKSLGFGYDLWEILLCFGFWWKHRSWVLIFENLKKIGFRFWYLRSWVLFKIFWKFCVRFDFLDGFCRKFWLIGLWDRMQQIIWIQIFEIHHLKLSLSSIWIWDKNWLHLYLLEHSHWEWHIFSIKTQNPPHIRTCKNQLLQKNFATVL